MTIVCGEYQCAIGGYGASDDIGALQTGMNVLDEPSPCFSTVGDPQFAAKVRNRRGEECSELTYADDNRRRTEVCGGRIDILHKEGKIGCRKRRDKQCKKEQTDQRWHDQATNIEGCISHQIFLDTVDSDSVVDARGFQLSLPPQI